MIWSGESALLAGHGGDQIVDQALQILLLAFVGDDGVIREVGEKRQHHLRTDHVHVEVGQDMAEVLNGTHPSHRSVADACGILEA